MPLKIRFGDKEYLDKFELTNEKFWELCMQGGALPQTAAPSAGQFQAAYQEAKAEMGGSFLRQAGPHPP